MYNTISILQSRAKNKTQQNRTIAIVTHSVNEAIDRSKESDHPALNVTNKAKIKLGMYTIPLDETWELFPLPLRHLQVLLLDRVSL